MNSATVQKRRWAILAVLSLSVFLVTVDNTIVNVALPTLSRDLGASTSALQWIVDAYSSVFAGLLLAAGSLGDRFGRKGALQFGLVAFGITSVLASLAGSSGELIAARAAMGVGAAFIFPATLAILSNVFTDPRERAQAIGLWAGVSGVGVALGPVTGGWLLEHFWWGSSFFVNAPIVIVALVAGHLLVPSSKDSHAGRFDLIGLALSVAAVTTLVYTVIEAPEHGWASTFALGGFGLAGMLLAAFIVWEQHRESPMLDLSVFQPRLVNRFGTAKVVAGGLALMASGFLVAATITATSSYWLHVVPSMVLIATGMGLTTAPATEAIMGALPRDKAGVGSAVNDTTRELGGTLGVAIVGSVFSSVYGPRLVEGLRGLPIPGAALDSAQESMAGAVAVADLAPADARPHIIDAASSAFIDGLSMGSLVVAGTAAAGAVIALRFLPARSSSDPAPVISAEPTPAGVELVPSV